MHSILSLFKRAKSEFATLIRSSHQGRIIRTSIARMFNPHKNIAYRWMRLPFHKNSFNYLEVNAYIFV